MKLDLLELLNAALVFYYSCQRYWDEVAIVISNLLFLIPHKEKESFTALLS